MDLKLRLKAKVHGCCAHSVSSDSQATTWVLTLYVLEKPLSSYCLAGLLKTVNKDSFEVCLLAIMLRRQKFELSGGPEQRRQHTGIHRWRGREFVHFADRTGGKLAAFIVTLIATVSYAKEPCRAVALKLQVSSVMSLQRFQTLSLSPGAGEVRKRTVVGESLHVRHLPNCLTRRLMNRKFGPTLKWVLRLKYRVKISL